MGGGAEDEDGSSDLTDPPHDERPDVWPPWEWPDFAGLARYVSLDGVRRAGLSDAATWEHQDLSLSAAARKAGRRKVAERLYDRLQSLWVSYALEPWTGDARQIIRDPLWLVDEAGTCIDFACAFAGMCLEARVAPYLAVTSGHAFIVLDLERDLAGDEAGVPIGSARAGDEHIRLLHAGDEDLADRIERGRLLPVDPTYAHRRDLPFGNAVRAANDRLLARAANDRTHGTASFILVDVVELHRRGVVPFLAPTMRRAFRAFLPPAPPFVPFGSRERVLPWLRRQRGRVVLHGAAGTGKSRLARDLAERWAGGSGWFLDASDPETLTTSLALAELFELGEQPASLELVDLQGYAAAAIQRLNQTQASWVVVLDNANGPPAELFSQLPKPRADGRQLLVVTTTNREWTRVPGFAAHELLPIDDVEVAEAIGVPTDATWLLELVQGRPLLAGAFRALASAGLDLSVPPAPTLLPPRRGDELDGPRAFWSLARARLASTACEVARLCAWAPADHIDAEVVDDLVTDGRAALADLESIGLLGRTGPALTMHRLFGRAIRELEVDQDRDVVRLARSSRARVSFVDRGDRATIDALTDALLAVADAVGVSRDLAIALHSLAMVQELHGRTERSAQLFRRAREGFDESIADDASYLADCLHGEARLVNQQQARDVAAIADAIRSMRRAEELRLQVDDGVGAARARALRGLLRQKEASFAEAGEKEAVLLDAKQLIDESYEQRRDAIGTDDHPEVIRAYFNKAGVRIQLAKLDPAGAAELLDEVAEVYEVARDRRTRLYRRPIHPHIAACVNGAAIVAYYQAVLVPGRTAVERSDWLRKATGYAVTALADRSVMDGFVDAAEASKSARLLAKIQIARRLGVLDPDRTDLAAARDDGQDLVDEVLTELYPSE